MHKQLLIDINNGFMLWKVTRFRRLVTQSRRHEIRSRTITEHTHNAHTVEIMKKKYSF